VVGWLGKQGLEEGGADSMTEAACSPRTWAPERHGPEKMRQGTGCNFRGDAAPAAATVAGQVQKTRRRNTRVDQTFSLRYKMQNQFYVKGGEKRRRRRKQ
jgi:hypothetical protein